MYFPAFYHLQLHDSISLPNTIILSSATLLVRKFYSFDLIPYASYTAYTILLSDIDIEYIIDGND